MKTMDERYDKGWALLREDMAKRDAALSDRIARATERMATASDRSATARWWQTGAMLAGIIIAVV